jgi:hypothetical protein
MYPSLHHLKVTFFKEATSFIQQMEEVIPAASDLLGSSNTTDVRCVCSNDSYARFSSVYHDYQCRADTTVGVGF